MKQVSKIDGKRMCAVLLDHNLALLLPCNSELTLVVSQKPKPKQHSFVFTSLVASLFSGVPGLENPRQWSTCQCQKCCIIIVCYRSVPLMLIGCPWRRFLEGWARSAPREDFAYQTSTFTQFLVSVEEWICKTSLLPIFLLTCSCAFWHCLTHYKMKV